MLPQFGPMWEKQKQSSYTGLFRSCKGNAFNFLKVKSITKNKGISYKSKNFESTSAFDILSVVSFALKVPSNKFNDQYRMNTCSENTW